MDQTEKFNVLGEKPVGKLLMQYAIPAIVAMTASSIYNIIDGIFIGQGVGKEAIMGLALTAPVMSLTAAFGAMVGVGAATLMSVRLGQKDYATAKKILGNVLIMNIVMGVTLGFVLQLCLTPILRFFGASDATLPFAHDFMTIILAGNVVTHLYLGLNALLRSTNRPMKAMYATGHSVGSVLYAALAIETILIEEQPHPPEPRHFPPRHTHHARIARHRPAAVSHQPLRLHGHDFHYAQHDAIRR